MTVCILDTGIDPRHIDLEGKLDLGISASFVAQERADRDFFSHGTDMASIVVQQRHRHGLGRSRREGVLGQVFDRTGAATSAT